MSKEQSAIVKGFAILMMLLYHLSCIPKIQDLDIFTSTLSSISHPILYFLVVSGYGLYCVYKQGRMTWSYLLKRSLKLYLAYWLVLLIFVFGIATWMYPDRFHYSPTGVVLNFLGWRWDYCKFTWFLLPYVLMCLSSKWVFRIIDRFGIVVSLIVAFALYPCHILHRPLLSHMVALSLCGLSFCLVAPDPFGVDGRCIDGMHGDRGKEYRLGQVEGQESAVAGRVCRLDSHQATAAVPWHPSVPCGPDYLDDFAFRLEEARQESVCRTW